MEVHHHPHTEKKGVKEYFLEFVIIFLAGNTWTCSAVCFLCNPVTLQQ